MKKLTVYLLLSLIAAFALVGCGVLQEPEAASGPIEAIPLETQSAGVAPVEATQPSADPAPTKATADEPTAETPAEAPAAGARVFTD